MKRYMAIIGAVVGTAAVLAVASTWLGLEIPPWATAQDVRALTVQVEANTEAGFLRQLENALARRDAEEVRRICNIISKLYGYKAAGCP